MDNYDTKKKKKKEPDGMEILNSPEKSSSAFNMLNNLCYRQSQSHDP